MEIEIHFLRNPTPIEECEIDNNGFDSFDLRLRENEILNGLDPLDFEISYYENEMDAFSGNTNTILDPKNFENTVVSKLTAALVKFESVTIKF